MVVFVVSVGDLVNEGLKEEEEERCMRDLVRVLCCVKDSRNRIRWDCGLFIRSRGRWGKCG